MTKRIGVLKLDFENDENDSSHFLNDCVLALRWVYDGKMTAPRTPISIWDDAGREND